MLKTHLIRQSWEKHYVLSVKVGGEVGEAMCLNNHGNNIFQRWQVKKRKCHWWFLHPYISPKFTQNESVFQPKIDILLSRVWTHPHNGSVCLSLVIIVTDLSLDLMSCRASIRAINLLFLSRLCPGMKIMIICERCERLCHPEPDTSHPLFDD